MRSDSIDRNSVRAAVGPVRQFSKAEREHCRGVLAEYAIRLGDRSVYEDLVGMLGLEPGEDPPPPRVVEKSKYSGMRW